MVVLRWGGPLKVTEIYITCMEFEITEIDTKKHQFILFYSCSVCASKLFIRCVLIAYAKDRQVGPYALSDRKFLTLYGIG